MASLSDYSEIIDGIREWIEYRTTENHQVDYMGLITGCIKETDLIRVGNQGNYDYSHSTRAVKIANLENPNLTNIMARANLKIDSSTTITMTLTLLFVGSACIIHADPTIIPKLEEVLSLTANSDRIKTEKLFSDIASKIEFDSNIRKFIDKFFSPAESSMKRKLIFTIVTDEDKMINPEALGPSSGGCAHSFFREEDGYYQQNGCQYRLHYWNNDFIERALLRDLLFVTKSTVKHPYYVGKKLYDMVLPKLESEKNLTDLVMGYLYG